MSYLVLARKYRPQAFDDVTGQEHVVQTLANAIANDRVAHAFLLCGPRGVGKTTTARLLARALNCAEGPTASPCGVCQPCKEIVAGSSIDVVEIDGASNNGVDNVRELREAARYMPQRDRHKVFIIDEVHMLSVQAFNALLKTLEEPPPHVKFVFATTDPQKLPDTILSRCQRHNFRRVPEEKMVERLRFICEAEGITMSDRSLALVARQADGGMRDALSLLDQLLSSAGNSIEDGAVEEALGLVDRTVVHELAGALLERDGKRVIETIAGVYDRGVDAKRLCEELATHLRDLVYVKAIGQAPGDRGDVEQRLLVEQAGKADAAQITRLFDLVHHAIRELSYAAQPRLALEVALLSAVHLAPAQGLADLAAKLDAVAGALGAGRPAPVAQQAAMQPGPAPMRAPAGAPPVAPQRPAPPRQAPVAAMPTSDLLKQVEALTRGKGAPRQAGGRPGGRGTPPDGNDEEPHGAAPARTPSRFAPPPAGGNAPTTRGPAGGSAPQEPASRFAPTGGGNAPAVRGAPPTGSNEPRAGGARVPFEVPAGLPTPRQGRPGGAPPSRSAASPEERRDAASAHGAPASRPGQSDQRKAIASRAAAPAPAWDDDEPPPPGDDDAPGWGDDGDFGGADFRPLQVDTSPGGCATNECRDEPAPVRPLSAAPARSLSTPAAPPARSFSPPAAPPARSFSPPAAPPARAFSMPTAPPAGGFTTPAAPPARGPQLPSTPLTAPPARGLQLPTTPPARTAPPPAAPPGGGDDPTAEVHARWAEAVDALRRENPIIGSCLSEGRLLWLRPGQIALGFGAANHFHRTQLETTFARQVGEMLTAWFKAPTRLHVQEAAADAPASVADEERKSREARRVRLRTEAREHPAVLAVQSILGGEIDDIEVLEER